MVVTLRLIIRDDKHMREGQSKSADADAIPSSRAFQFQRQLQIDGMGLRGWAYERISFVAGVGERDEDHSSVSNKQTLRVMAVLIRPRMLPRQVFAKAKETCANFAWIASLGNVCLRHSFTH